MRSFSDLKSQFMFKQHSPNHQKKHSKKIYQQNELNLFFVGFFAQVEAIGPTWRFGKSPTFSALGKFKVQETAHASRLCSQKHMLEKPTTWICLDMYGSPHQIQKRIIEILCQLSGKCQKSNCQTGLWKHACWMKQKGIKSLLSAVLERSCTLHDRFTWKGLRVPSLPSGRPSSWPRPCPPLRCHQRRHWVCHPCSKRPSNARCPRRSN